MDFMVNAGLAIGRLPRQPTREETSFFLIGKMYFRLIFRDLFVAATFGVSSGASMRRQEISAG